MRLGTEKQTARRCASVKTERFHAFKVQVEAKMYNEPEDISDLSKTSEGQGFNVVPSKKVSTLAAKTSYRKPKASEAELREKREHARVEEEQRQRFLATQDLQAEPSKPLQPPIMLIDAYNIMHIDLPSFMLTSESWDFARGELERRVLRYAEAAGVHCVIVYDALGRCKQKNKMNREERISNRVSRLFTAGEEADSYIVRRALNLKASGHRKVEIVSNDQRILMECDDLHEFVIYSVDANQFVKDLQDCGRGQVEAVQSRKTVQSTALNNLKYFEQNRAASRAAAAERSERVKLPELCVSEVSQKLEFELTRIKVEGSMSSSSEEEDEEEDGRSNFQRVSPMAAVQGKAGTRDNDHMTSGSPSTVLGPLVKDDQDISSVLNELFSTSKTSRTSLSSNIGQRRRRSLS